VTGGINVVGYLHAENGIGEAARRLVETADRAGITRSLAVVPSTARSLHHFDGSSALDAPQDTNIVVVPADAFAPIGAWLRSTPLGAKPTVGWWRWDGEAAPEAVGAGVALLDEIWTHSEFDRAAIAGLVDVPVRVLNPPVRLPASAPARSRRALGLPEGFVFFSSFDYLSGFERKNPVAVVEAFTRAFAADEGPTLLVKGVNAAGHPAQRDALVRAAAGRADIRIWHDYVDAATQDALVSTCDAYVSLHRTTSFGLTLADAMAAGKPVVATAYSGNLDYMGEANSFLVPAGDVDAAAQALRRVWRDTDEVAKRTTAARRDIETRHSIEVRAKQLNEMLRDVRPRVRGTAAPDPTRSAKGRARDRLGTVVRRMEGREELEERIESVSNALHATAANVDALSAALQRLQSQIDVDPYIADPGALRVIGPDGRERMGFDGAADEPFYVGFEELFRGPEPLIRERLEAYLPLLADRAPVVDLGCGRGELLDLLAERGVEAWGVDADAEVAAAPLAKGHRVEVADALSVLRDVAPGSVGAVFSSQFIEHIDPGALADLIAASRRALRAGGVFIAETVNPHSIASFKTFWLDPTHKQPLFPETVLLMCRAAGFGSGYVLFPDGPGDLATDRTTSGSYAVVAEVDH
jgi:glycosyltransferase involved in cell wall biosynthesis/SAM-dependent methyltransferase